MPGLISSLFSRGKSVNLEELKKVFEKFKQILSSNNNILEHISDLEDKLSGEYIFDINYLKQTIGRISEEIESVIKNLNYISHNNYQELYTRRNEILTQLENILNSFFTPAADVNTIKYDEVTPYMTESTGGKNANLGEIRNYLKIDTPDGIIVTTHAYYKFIEYNNLWSAIEKKYQNVCSDDKKESVKLYDDAIENLFANSELPEELEKSIMRGITDLLNTRGTINFAVRSSAYGEDDERLSYAGQFESYLNCKTEDICSAYKRVVASRFKYNVMSYGNENSFDKAVLPMAVGIQELIESETAGVIYTVDPSGACPDCLLISAGYGLGTSVVAGTINADYYKVSRLDPDHIQERIIGKKDTKIVTDESGGIKSISIGDELKVKACLSNNQIIELAETALILDRYFKRPLDIEWCFDRTGKLFILQCRPLHIPRKAGIEAGDLKSILSGKKVILYKKGQIAQRGIAAGRVSFVKEDDDPLMFPPGGIAVTKYTTPRLSRIIRRAKAIITDVGSSTGHMATVAREFGVPMIVGAENATELLCDGDEITVDAEENVIYEGIIKELLVYETEAEDVFRELREYKMLRQLLRKIAPLMLIDPKSPKFTAKNCMTYHDILRFSHEKAMLELVNLNMSSGRFKAIKTKNLRLTIPLGLSIIDLGDGLHGDMSGSTIESVEQIRSIPMKAILEGLLEPGVWSTEPIQLGIGDLLSSITRYSLSEKNAEYTGQNLAVISEKYTNLSLRLGYHFNVIDTYVSDNINDNYVYFRFVGGVTETERRNLRAVLLKEILEKMNFIVTITGDLVVARLKKWESDQILLILKHIGKLIGFSRQLDTQMESNESVEKYLKEFYNNL